MNTESILPPNDVLQRQETQHASIRALIEDILVASSNEEVAPMLAELTHTLGEHFDHEEDSGGVFAGLLQEDPCLQGDVDALVRQHAQFRARLSEAGLWGKDAVILAHALAEDLAKHERVENDLIAGVFYDDMQAAD